MSIVETDLKQSFSQAMKRPPTLSHEQFLWDQGIRPIAGVDEAGRGPLAGPVIAAAVIFPERFDHLLQESLTRLNDSKKLSTHTRAQLYAILTTHPDICWSIGEASVTEIGNLNILRATALAMRRALLHLKIKPAHALVDGLRVRDLPVNHTALIKGDGLSLSIAAASVIAKVTRDSIMDELDQAFPLYGFQRHRGYGTQEHLKQLHQHGPCAHHRPGFKPVDQATLKF